VARKDKRILETEFREESLAIAQKLQAHATASGRTLTQFALAWLWSNRIVTSVIAGPRTLEQWKPYVEAVGTPWSDVDDKLVDALVPPGHPSTPGYNDPAYPIEGRRARTA
jgi:aryl-alcohol dehydrogenase-like predicted oxidoreductase